MRPKLYFYKHKNDILRDNLVFELWFEEKIKKKNITNEIRKVIFDKCLSEDKNDFLGKK